MEAKAASGEGAQDAPKPPPAPSDGKPDLSKMTLAE